MDREDIPACGYVGCHSKYIYDRMRVLGDEWQKVDDLGGVSDGLLLEHDIRAVDHIGIEVFLWAYSL